MSNMRPCFQTKRSSQATSIDSCGRKTFFLRFVWKIFYEEGIIEISPGSHPQKEDINRVATEPESQGISII